jgi:uncharacterized protein YqgV (UPF0045/DUF77 family)
MNSMQRDLEVEATMDKVLELVKALRKAKAEHNKSDIVEVVIEADLDHLLAYMQGHHLIEHLAKVRIT